MYKLVIAITLGLALAAPAGAAPSPDPIADALIPPEIVMSHQQELGISDAQRTTLQTDMQEAQSRFTSLQWQLSAAVERLRAILAQAHVDENAALAQLDREQAIERDIKRTQLQLMIRIKNVLSPEQQAKAFAIKRAAQ
jgi:Spy/CpxP family protein refolding chaperone